MTDRFHVGDQILVPITMTNTSANPVAVCSSADFYQDQPTPINLNPNEPKMVDWLVLVDSKVPSGADAWYDSLPPGKYELSIQRVSSVVTVQECSRTRLALRCCRKNEA